MAFQGLHPFPTGWYCLGFHWELRAPQHGIWCGRRLRTRPVRDGVQIEAFDGRPCHIVHQQDAVFLWHNEAGGPPDWALPVLEETGWSRYSGHCWPRLRSHPQETSENSVDIAHFTFIHGYEDVREIAPATVEGPILSARYGITRNAIPFIHRHFKLQAEFNVQVIGLGYSLVENNIRNLGIRTRQMVYATPLDGNHIALRIAGSVRSLPLGPLKRPVNHLARWAMMQGFIQDVTDDLVIWENKRFLDRPRVVSGDGPIGRYRAWARQFYPATAS
ncbi:MAG: hypothetical protein AAFV53_14290 [Myxococcota bacterium]